MQRERHEQRQNPTESVLCAGTLTHERRALRNVGVFVRLLCFVLISNARRPGSVSSVGGFPAVPVALYEQDKSPEAACMQRRASITGEWTECLPDGLMNCGLSAQLDGCAGTFPLLTLSLSLPHWTLSAFCRRINRGRSSRSKTDPGGTGRGWRSGDALLNECAVTGRDPCCVMHVDVRGPSQSIKPTCGHHTILSAITSPGATLRVLHWRMKKTKQRTGCSCIPPVRHGLLVVEKSYINKYPTKVSVLAAVCRAAASWRIRSSKLSSSSQAASNFKRPATILESQ